MHSQVESSHGCVDNAVFHIFDKLCFYDLYAMHVTEFRIVFIVVLFVFDAHPMRRSIRVSMGAAPSQLGPTIQSNMGHARLLN